MKKFKDFFSASSITVLAGFFWAIFISYAAIAENRYFQYGMIRLIAKIFQRNVNIVVCFLFFIFLALYIAWFILTKKMKAAKNDIMNFAIALGVLLSSLWCFIVFNKNVLHLKVKDLWVLVQSVSGGQAGFGYFLSLLKTNILTVAVLTLWFILTCVLICLLFKLKWDKIISFIGGKYIRRTGLASFFILIMLNVVLIIDNKLSPAGPNVILLVVDAWRADSLGCYNKNSDATSNVDQFSKTAVLFKNAVAQSPNTFNSAPSIFSSVYPSEHKYFNYKCRVSDKFNTIAEFLKNEKYKTFGISSNPHVTSRNGLSQGFDVFVEDTIWKDTDCDEINERFIKWLDHNKDSKFFAMLWYIDPHSPYEPPTEYVDKYIVTEEERNNITNKAKSKAGKRKGLITEVEKEVAKKLYKGEVNFFDTEFKSLIKHLEHNGFLENSIIILTADHGESFWEKVFLNKSIRGHGGSLYEEEIKIPFIISLPGQKEGKVVSEKVQHNDILPTILEYVKPESNIADIPFLRGIGLRGLIEGKKNSRKYFFSQLIDNRKDCPPYRMECIQTNEFKLIKTFEFVGKTYEPPNFQLFNLNFDEAQCDIEDEDLKPVFSELKYKLTSWHENIRDAKGKSENGKLAGKSENKDEDELLKQRLKSLGYVQ